MVASACWFVRSFYAYRMIIEWIDAFISIQLRLLEEQVSEERRLEEIGNQNE